MPRVPRTDAILGKDGLPRCPWAGTSSESLARYHDEVWGTPTHDESAMFGALTLGVFEVGLSWSIVFGKRAAFRKERAQPGSAPAADQQPVAKMTCPWALAGGEGGTGNAIDPGLGVPPTMIPQVPT